MEEFPAKVLYTIEVDSKQRRFMFVNAEYIATRSGYRQLQISLYSAKEVEEVIQYVGGKLLKTPMTYTSFQIGETELARTEVRIGRMTSLEGLVRGSRRHATKNAGLFSAEILKDVYFHYRF